MSPKGSSSPSTFTYHLFHLCATSFAFGSWFVQPQIHSQFENKAFCSMSRCSFIGCTHQHQIAIGWPFHLKFCMEHPGRNDLGGRSKEIAKMKMPIKWTASPEFGGLEKPRFWWEGCARSAISQMSKQFQHSPATATDSSVILLGYRGR